MAPGSSLAQEGGEALRGIVKSANEAMIGTDLIFPIASLPFREGQHFSKGDVLVAFTLTEGFTIKKISFLDLAFEGRPEASGDEAFDADLALATGELGRLIPALAEGLGGEHDFAAAGTAPAPVPAALPAAEAVAEEAPPW